MNILIIILPVVLSGIVGMVLDLKFHYSGGAVHWMLGALGVWGSLGLYILVGV